MSFKPPNPEAAFRQARLNQEQQDERVVDFGTTQGVTQKHPSKRYAGAIFDPESPSGITGEFGRFVNTTSGPTHNPIATQNVTDFMTMFKRSKFNQDLYPEEHMMPEFGGPIV